MTGASSLASENPAREPRALGGPSYQQTLRTIGLMREASDVRRAALSLGPDGVRVQTTSACCNRPFTWHDLAIQARALQAQRRSQRPTYTADPWTLARWSVLLRGAGALLDGIGPDACELHVTVPADAAPEAVVLRARGGRGPVHPSGRLRALLRLRMRHDRTTYP